MLKARGSALGAAGHSVISLGQAIPGFGPPQAALDAARAALADSDTHLYSADAGLPTLRETLCRHLKVRHAIDVIPDEVIVTAGGNQALMVALMTLVDPGDEVLLPAPFFSNHEMAIKAIGAHPIEIALSEEQGFVVRWEDLAPHITARTRALVICTPSNPTGAVVDPDETTSIVRELAARNIAVFTDEAYMDFVYEGGQESAPVTHTRHESRHWSVASLPAWRDNVVLTSTFSKSFGMTGWRVGYMLADRRVTDQAIKIQDAMVICAPVISQIAVEAALREVPDYPLSFREELKARRTLLARRINAVPGLHWTPTRGGFFALVRVDGCTDSVSLSYDVLDRAHVVTIPGSIFGRAAEGYLRLSYGAAGAAEIDEACDRIEEYFRSQR